MRRIIIVFMTSIFCILIVGCSVNSDERIRMPASSSDYQGENYQDVINDFESAGFTNVDVERIEDLVIGWLKKDGEVKQVEVDGNSSFSARSKFPSDVKIVVTYHTYPSRDRNDKNTSMSTSETKEENDVIQPTAASYMIEEEISEPLQIINTKIENDYPILTREEYLNYTMDSIESALEESNLVIADARSYYHYFRITIRTRERLTFEEYQQEVDILVEKLIDDIILIRRERLSFFRDSDILINLEFKELFYNGQFVDWHNIGLKQISVDKLYDGKENYLQGSIHSRSWDAFELYYTD